MKLSKSLKVMALSSGVAMLAGCGMSSEQMQQMSNMQESMNEMMRMVNTIDYNASQAKKMASDNKMMMRMMMNRMDMKDGMKGGMMKKDKMMMKKMMK